MKTYSFWIKKLKIIERTKIKNKLCELNKLESNHKKKRRCIYLIFLKRYLLMISPMDGNNYLIKNHY
jgi:hypothetical protein